MVDVVVKGAEDFYALSKRLKQVAPELRKELNKGLREGAKPLIADVKQSARDSLPHRGGLAARVARSGFRVQVRTGAATAGVRIIGSRKANLAALNRGVDRHPTWGHRDRWVTQQVPAGWFDRPTQTGAPKIRPALQRVMDDMARRITRG